jgi:hypothetical protein
MSRLGLGHCEDGKTWNDIDFSYILKKLYSAEDGAEQEV